MKKVITIGLAGLLAVSLLGPAAAAKKKKKKPPAPAPVELQFFMRRDDCNTDADNPHLSLTDAEDFDCIPSATLNNVYGPEIATDVYPAADGVPLTLDPTRKVTGSLSLRSWNGAGIGIVDVDIKLLGVIAGEEKELGAVQTSYTAVPAETAVVTYEIELDPALAGAVAEGLTLTVFTHGANAGIAGGVEHDDPPSWVKVPALQ
ncbi:MAG TPA: hypothetical protein VHN37_00065 [Actinomycetota bacterium]|nr:hypothetical protein [Actinomycetota bacterium]